MNRSFVIDEMILPLESFVTKIAGEGSCPVHGREVGVQAPLIR